MKATLVVWRLFTAGSVDRSYPAGFCSGTANVQPGDMNSAGRFTHLRAWQTADAFKKAVYRLTASGPLSRDEDRRRQLEKCVCSATANIAEGFGRFNPPDFARFAVIARASLMEAQNHLLDLVDKEFITADQHREFNALAEEALREVTGLIGYLQSEEALRNARRIKERLAARTRTRTGT